jgi:predicted alpha/beta superfamily hydrolase
LINLTDSSYVTDGNSVFLSALEIMHRQISIGTPPLPAGVIVAIGYPIPDESPFLFNERRNKDLTPTSPGEKNTEGGAGEFIEFFEKEVRPLVHRRLQETGATGKGKEALYGHSYGGLFCLHSLFTRPELFDYYIASSPSIWWNKGFLLTEEASFSQTGDANVTRPSLLLYAGGLEQDPVQYCGEEAEHFQWRVKRCRENKMVDNVLDMYDRLRKSNRLRSVLVHIYEGENHGSIIACSLNTGLANFFENI